ncbi:MAG: hypothetical protein PUB37_00705 [Firmicutes bacterium]|nr:hypothetical protein [Bacillota bacterium]
MRIKTMVMAVLMLLSTVLITACDFGNDNNKEVTKKMSYMIYYGELTDSVIKNAKRYDIAILHPAMGNITREQVQKIQAGGTMVFGYITVGEDLRTAGLTAEQMLEDERFTADGTGPRVDPRLPENTSLDGIDISGVESPGGTGYASYYLDDNDRDGKPDINPTFTCAYTNIGDPAWFDVLNEMTIDGADRIPGFKEILTTNYGRGLGCDGVFLDTVDTCAPNYYTEDSNPNRTRFEWTAPGVADFIAKIKQEYPDKLVCQNRGLFFYNPQTQHYKYTPRQYIDYLMFESYMLDSNTTDLYNENYFADNKYNYLPKLMAEAGRPDGFKILSLGYAEGPEEYQLKETLLGKSEKGKDILTRDINEAQSVGFSHYITNGRLTTVNNFVLENQKNEDVEPPVWSSVYNNSSEWPPHEPEARVGIGQIEPVKGGVIVRWDVALDMNEVIYTLYYQDAPFDFENDPDLSKAQSVELTPEIGDGYSNGPSAAVYPYQAEITGLASGETYYFVIRAKDTSANHNEEKNTAVRMEIPR